MQFNREFYEKNKKVISKVSKKLLDFYKEIGVNNLSASNLDEEGIEEAAISASKYYESKVIYTTYLNSYDPRVGQTLVLYCLAIDFTDKVEEVFRKCFGEFSIRDKAACKNSNYRVFKKKSLDILLPNDIDYNLRLNIIFNGDINADMQKYHKFMNKAPKGVKY